MQFYATNPHDRSASNGQANYLPSTHMGIWGAVTTSDFYQQGTQQPALKKLPEFSMQLYLTFPDCRFHISYMDAKKKKNHGKHLVWGKGVFNQGWNLVHLTQSDIPWLSLTLNEIPWLSRKQHFSLIFPDAWNSVSVATERPTCYFARQSFCTLQKTCSAIVRRALVGISGVRVHGGTDHIYIYFRRIC